MNDSVNLNSEQSGNQGLPNLLKSNDDRGQKIPDAQSSFNQSSGSQSLNEKESLSISNPTLAKAISKDEEIKQLSPPKSSMKEISQDSRLNLNNNSFRPASDLQEKKYHLHLTCRGDFLVITAITQNPLCRYEKEIRYGEIENLFGREIIFLCPTVDDLKNQLEEAVQKGNKETDFLVYLSSDGKLNIRNEVMINKQKSVKEINIQLEERVKGAEVINLSIAEIRRLTQEIVGGGNAVQKSQLIENELKIIEFANNP